MPRRKVSQGQFMNGPSQGTVFVVAANTGSAKVVKAKAFTEKRR